MGILTASDHPSAKRGYLLYDKQTLTPLISESPPTVFAQLASSQLGD